MSKKRKKRMSNSERGRLISIGKKARKIEALEQQLVVLDKEIQNKESEAFTVAMRIKDAEKEIEHLNKKFNKTISEIETLRKELKETAEKWREEQKNE